MQVLKGPQGTLFGRSTTGGAVLLQPAAPTNEWGGYARFRLGNYNTLQAEGALNIPVVKDVLAIRLAALQSKRDGYAFLSSNLPASVTSRFSDPAFVARQFGRGSTFVNNQVLSSGGKVLVNNGQVISGATGQAIEPTAYNNQDSTDVRATIRFTPDAHFENSTILTYHRDHNLGSTTGGLLVLRNAVGVPSGVEGQAGTGTYTSYTSVSPQHPENHAFAAINTTSFALTDNVKLRNIFGYIHADGYTLDGYDVDGGPGRIVDTFVSRRARQSRQYTDEVQLQGAP